MAKGPKPKIDTEVRRLAKYGPKPKSLRERFEAKVVRHEGENACWEWVGGKNGKAGYGMLYDRDTGQKELAHRVAYKLEHGVYPIDTLLHLCDKPACVRVSHTVQGTQAENMADMRAKGRLRFKSHIGEKNGNAKLNSDRVREIRRAYKVGGSYAGIAAAQKVSEGLVYAVISKRLWAHVPDEETPQNLV